MQKVVIIGGGRIGTALTKVLDINGFEVLCCDRDKARCTPGAIFPEAIEGAYAVFLCIPSWEIRNALREIKPFLDSSPCVISLAKGIEPETKKMVDEVLKEVLGKEYPYAVFGGPLFAEELEKGQHGFGVVGTRSEKAHEIMCNLFHKSSIILLKSYDVRGVALLGVLKNVYAMACGMLDGIGEGNNAKGHLIARAIDEMEEILRMLGGDPHTVRGDAGIGDFVATAVSSYSRNRTSGEEFIRGKKKEELQSESVKSLSLLCERLGNEAILKLPLLRAIHEVIENHNKEIRAKIVHEFLDK